MLRRVVEATAAPETAGAVNFTSDTYTNRHTSLCARCSFFLNLTVTHSFQLASTCPQRDSQELSLKHRLGARDIKQQTHTIILHLNTS